MDEELSVPFTDTFDNAMLLLHLTDASRADAKDHTIKLLLLLSFLPLDCKVLVGNLQN